ncbi:MAG TPA: toxin-antitoxin system HicB family antitoxin [Planctomycetota bacterium]|jgi:hypothetical protein|nr:toxin-antitoxin system HicB family antitoxin [Planctomycetota bacterium]
MKTYSGKILIRVPSSLHRDLAEEAFRSGRSINALCLEALIARRALKGYDPWRAIEKIWRENRGVPPDRVAEDVAAALREARRGR